MMKRYTIVIHGCLNCFPLLSFLFFRVCLVAIVLLFSCCVSFGIDQVVDRVLRTPTGQKWHSFARTAHFKATPYLAYFFNVTFEHYMDVVLTTVETDDFAIDVYEYTVHSHHYQSSDRPHARYDLCPVTETLFFFFPMPIYPPIIYGACTSVDSGPGFHTTHPQCKSWSASTESHFCIS